MLFIKLNAKFHHFNILHTTEWMCFAAPTKWSGWRMHYRCDFISKDILLVGLIT